MYLVLKAGVEKNSAVNEDDRLDGGGGRKQQTANTWSNVIWFRDRMASI